MQIQRMTATFGTLQNRTLELREGLNIIQAPNESGKSTWCAFMLSMFYGINSRERDKAGFIADKNRYAPWSGTAMSGRMDCVAKGQALRLTRTTRRPTAPLGEFQADYAGTGTPADLTGQDCGETLLGVNREVFERSAFIRQAGLAISQDAGLERRIAALISSGEEDTSYSEAADALKKQLNRRRHNKTGLLPALELDLREIESQLAQVTALEADLLQARREAAALEAQEAALRQELEAHDRWAARAQRQALAQAETAVQEAQARVTALRQRLEREQTPEMETIGRLRGAIVNLETVRRSVDKARAERDEAMKALLRAERDVGESPFGGQSPETAQKAAANLPLIQPKLWWLAGLLAALGAGGALWLVKGAYPLWMGLALGAGGLLLAALALTLPAAADRKKQSAYLAAHGVDTAAELQALADAYSRLCEARDTAQAAVSAKSATADALYASLSSNEQGILLEVRRFAPSAFDIPAADGALRDQALRRKELSEAEAMAREATVRYDLLRGQTPDGALDSDGSDRAPARSRADTEAAWNALQGALSAARSAADRLGGQLHGLGDAATLHSQREQLTAQRELLEGEHAAISLALSALDDANTTLQTRFSPALGRRAAEIFAHLTGGRYQGVVLDRSFHLSAEPAGDAVYRDAALLSAGAADQLYLAVRLAICDLVLPEETMPPIILDDALANFDAERCAAALRWLKEEGKRRQILLLTCHDREAAFFAGDGEVFVQRLTDVV